MNRIIAVHDISGYGRCSLGVVLPVLAAMGTRACPLPTAYLSAHTAFPASDKAVFWDLTDALEPSLAHWDELKGQFNGFYSGFLGSVRQIGLLRNYLAAHTRPDFLIFIDPVMGDHGAPYRTYTPEMCGEMASLAALADVITPNLTEAALLLGEEYDPCPSWEKAQEWLARLSLDGRRSVVLTGLSSAQNRLGAGCWSRSTAQASLFEAPLAPGHFAGSGDLFASILLGRLLSGGSLEDGTETAVSFVSRAAHYTLAQGDDPTEGVSFEPLLPLLSRQVGLSDSLGL